MPELPEVETVRRGLEADLVGSAPLKKIIVRRSDLRVRFPSTAPGRLEGRRVVAVRRRAKYLLIDWGDHVLLNHLGMTGSWRRLSGPQDLLPHDHVLLDFGAHGTWVFHDPRRFGFFDLHPAAEVEQCRWLKHLGPDPWPQPVSGTELFQRVRNRSGTIKSLIMDQSVLTGVGNIYASEALFQARLRPQRKGKSLREPDLNRLVASIRSVLEVAISHGGSTIRDYRSASGERGSFQNQLFVYGRAGEPCRRCSVPIREVRLAGRSTFWCSQCQS